MTSINSQEEEKMITRVMTPVNGLEVLMPVLGKETTTADMTYMYWQGVDGFKVSFLVMLEDGVWYPLTKEIAESYGITEEELKEHAEYMIYPYMIYPLYTAKMEDLQTEDPEDQMQIIDQLAFQAQYQKWGKYKKYDKKSRKICVLTNTDHREASGVLINEHVRYKLYQIFQCDLILLPVSTERILILPTEYFSWQKDFPYMRDLLQYFNQISKENDCFFSDSIFYLRYIDEKRSILSKVPGETSIKIDMGSSMDYIRISALKWRMQREKWQPEVFSYIMQNLYVINYAGKALRERYPDAMSAEEKKAFADSEEALQKNFDPYREGDLLNLLNLLKRQQGSEEDLSEVDGLKMADTCKSDLKMYQSNILAGILKEDNNLKELHRHMIENLVFSCQEMMLNCRHLLETNDTAIDPVKLKVWYKACKYFLNEPYNPWVDPVDDTICDAIKDLKEMLQPSLMAQEIFEKSAASGEWQW